MQKKSYFLNLEVPEQLASYIDLITDLRWTWSHAGDRIWRTMDQQIWEQTENPHAVLQNLSQERLNELVPQQLCIDRFSESRSGQMPGAFTQG